MKTNLNMQIYISIHFFFLLFFFKWNEWNSSTIKTLWTLNTTHCRLGVWIQNFILFKLDSLFSITHYSVWLLVFLWYCFVNLIFHSKFDTLQTFLQAVRVKIKVSCLTKKTVNSIVFTKIHPLPLKSNITSSTEISLLTSKKILNTFLLFIYSQIKVYIKSNYML
jgi:hypothetical protein